MTKASLTRAYSDLEAADSGPAGSGGLSSRSMNLKGADPDSVIGRCMIVKYDEGGELVPYVGVVVYAEPSRLHAVFDGFDEADGAWVDDSDDWRLSLIHI